MVSVGLLVRIWYLHRTHTVNNLGQQNRSRPEPIRFSSLAAECQAS